MKIKIYGDREITVLGIVKALKSYGDIVENEILNDNYECVLISVTDEEINGLRDFIKAPFEISLDDLEIMYENLMRNFGETSVPPEAYVRAVKLADEKNIPIKGIDIPDGIYEDLYLKFINVSDLIFLSLRKNRLFKRKWGVEDPEETSIEWDRAVTKGGYRKLENEREKYIAERISSENFQKILVILEVERIDGIMGYLKNQMPEYRFQMI